MHIEAKKTAIAVGNVMTGIYNFIVLGIPQQWRVLAVPMASDAFSTIKQGDVKWVTDGIVEHVIRTSDRSATLRIKIKRGIKEAKGFKELKNAVSNKEIRFNIHKASVYKYKTKRLWHTDDALGVHVNCPETGRSILVEFINGANWIEEVLEFLHESQCHVSTDLIAKKEIIEKTMKQTEKSRGN